MYEEKGVGEEKRIDDNDDKEKDDVPCFWIFTFDVNRSMEYVSGEEMRLWSRRPSIYGLKALSKDIYYM